MYSLMKEHGDGEYHRDNIYVEAAFNPMQVRTNISDLHDLMHASEEEKENFRQAVAHNLATSFEIPERQGDVRQRNTQTKT